MSENAQRVAEVVKSALEREPEEWPAFLDEACAGDEELRAEIESLLKQQELATRFIETSALHLAAESLVREGAFHAGQIIGDYEILSLIGSGGMGEVYLAQDRQLHRKAALKLIRRGMDSDDIIRHFKHEERLLASLNHPNIAQLYGSGVTADGIPFFAMEYVEGERLDQYCNERQLGTDERLKLFRKVCAAVTYAHQHLVIHRDLKPANIRVTAEGEPKLLDFGIAKLLHPEDDQSSGQTLTLQGVMTPEYASPEQVRGENITTASDVYSLGVVLYELLTGQRPYRIASSRPDEIARAITEQEPTRPSTAITKFKDNQKSAFINQKSLRGDLDNIVLMAMRKEPARRYSSVGQFSEDIRRHLEGLPVIARKDTFVYRSSKFVGRHRVGVAAAALIFLSLIAGILATVSQARAAERERIKAERISAFLQETLGAAAPEAKGIDVKVSDVLNEASRRAKSELAQQPDVLAEVLTTLGRTYISLGLYASAIADLRAAVEAARKARSQGAAASATAWLAMALEYDQKSAEALEVAQRSVSLNRTLSPQGSANVAIALYSLGASQMDTGDLKGAEVNLNDAVELARKYFGENHGYYLAALNMLALIRQKTGDYESSKELCRRVLDAREHVEKRYRIYIAQAAACLGQVLIDTAEYGEAENFLRQAESIYRDVLGENNSSLPILKTYAGKLYLRMGDYRRAEVEYRQALELFPAYFASDHPPAFGAKAGLGQVLTRQDKPKEGEQLLREALKIRQRVLPAADPELAYNKSALGECLLAQKRFAEAELLLVQAYHELQSVLAASDPRVVETRLHLARLYENWGKPNEATRYRTSP